MTSFVPTDLGPVSRALREEPAFLAGWLTATPGGEPWVRERLGLTETSLHRLLACRAPRPQRFLDDVRALAGFVDVDATYLAIVLREAAVMAALGSRPTSSPSEDVHGTPGLLAAARDTVAEQLPRSQAVARIRELAEGTWRAAPADVRDRRDIQAAIVWASPVVVVSLTRLHMAAANRWLADHGVPQLPDAVGDLRGLLVAWRGQAAIFVDGTLPPADRRFTVAHEHGHFLLDYLGPRQRAMHDAPDLLDVLDGHRQPSDADRARAALARVPLGLHTHLLHRHDGGGATESTVAAEDDASTYALEVLAPWEDLLRLLGGRTPPAGAYRERLAAAVDAVAEKFELPQDAAKVRAATGLAALGVRPRFFDR